MEALFALFAPGHPSLAVDNQSPERVSAPWASLSPFSLVHLLMVSPFLSSSTSWHMMHAKSNAIGDHPAGGTLHGLSEGGDGRASSRYFCPHHRGPLRLHAVIEVGNKDKPCPPTTPSSASHPRFTVSATSPAVSPVPTTHTSKSNSNASRAVGSVPEDPPTYVQIHHGGAAPGYLGDGGSP